MKQSPNFNKLHIISKKIIKERGKKLKLSLCLTKYHAMKIHS